MDPCTLGPLRVNVSIHFVIVYFRLPWISHERHASYQAVRRPHSDIFCDDTSLGRQLQSLVRRENLRFRCVESASLASAAAAAAV